MNTNKYVELLKKIKEEQKKSRPTKKSSDYEALYRKGLIDGLQKAYEMTEEFFHEK